MNRAEPKSAAVSGRHASGPPRGDVQALLALVALDESVARREASVASNPALDERASSALARLEPELRARRGAITSRIPREALETYESALRRGLLPAAVATRGTVCWGCFHRLSTTVTALFLDEEAFQCCPHCERLLYNPDWTERP
jgi:predicted  nucleic acid-binding Zn-ribbon protein